MVDNYCILMVAGSRLLFKPATLIFIRQRPRHKSRTTSTPRALRGRATRGPCAQHTTVLKGEWKGAEQTAGNSQPLAGLASLCLAFSAVD